MAIFPGDNELCAQVLEPRRLLFKRLALDGCNIGVAQQSLVVHNKFAINNSIRSTIHFQAPRAHASIITFQENEFPNVGRVLKIHLILLHDLIILHPDPLKLQIVDTDSSLPSVSFVGELDVANNLLHRKLEADFLARHNAGRTGNEYTLIVCHEGEGLPRADTRRDHHFKHLRLGSCARLFTNRRRDDAHLHVGTSVGWTCDHKSLSFQTDSELHAWVNVRRDRHQETLGGSTFGACSTIHFRHFRRHGYSTAS
mmetsp:Transcript_20541/g.30445  ORF Transcript_20541/g.30445 Transcript_20541/m.30445 type:complete len:255 (-) Transcript_20541:802-1566(-)